MYAFNKQEKKKKILIGKSKDETLNLYLNLIISRKFLQHASAAFIYLSARSPSTNTRVQTSCGALMEFTMR